MLLLNLQNGIAGGHEGTMYTVVDGSDSHRHLYRFFIAFIINPDFLFDGRWSDGTSYAAESRRWRGHHSRGSLQIAGTGGKHGGSFEGCSCRAEHGVDVCSASRRG
jgi:hypothetical protein